MSDCMVTIIVPVYKVEKYLERCLDSILRQSYKNLEIILVDDCSPDKSPELCDAWAARDSRIRVIHKAQNEGAGLARNTGLDYANGEYVLFVDCDDYIDPETVSTCLRTAVETSAEVVVFGNCNVDAAGRMQYYGVSERRVFGGKQVLENFLPNLLDADPSFAHASPVARAMLLAMAPIRDHHWRFVSERTVASEDMYSLAVLFRYVRCVTVIPEPLYYYCENEVSLTHSLQINAYERIRTFNSEMQKLFSEPGYGTENSYRATNLYLSYTIAVLKQIAAAENDAAIRLRKIRQIVDDPMLQCALKKVKNRRQKMTREILFFAMRRRLYRICDFLIKAKA